MTDISNNQQSEKKTWLSPQVFIISDNDIEGGNIQTKHEGTFFTGGPGHFHLNTSNHTNITDNYYALFVS